MYEQCNNPKPGKKKLFYCQQSSTNTISFLKWKIVQHP